MTILSQFYAIKKHKYHCDLSGDYQKKNITTALTAINELKLLGIKIDQTAIIEGLKNIKASTFFIGRWMIMGRKPMAIFDSAHNEGGIKELVLQLKKLKFDHLHFVYGTVADKDITHILSMLPARAAYYFCRPDIPRGKDASELQKEATIQKHKGSVYPSVKKALKTALSQAKKNDLVLVSGSIFVVAEVI